LVNKGEATTEDLFKARNQIQAEITKLFNITFEQEPLFVG
jgi:UDP-N-acetylenolpyruvoylglucosamine reductase